MQIYNYSNVHNPEFMAKGIMVGRFDPFTVSHKKMAEIGSQLFDELIIMPAKTVMGTPKNEFLPFDVRVKLIKESVKELPNVKVDYYDGYTGEYAKEHNIDFILRGARDGCEFEFEQNLADFNKRVNSNLKTIIFPENDKTNSISATKVRNNIANDRSITGLVPEPVKHFIDAHLQELKNKLRKAI